MRNFPIVIALGLAVAGCNQGSPATGAEIAATEASTPAPADTVPTPAAAGALLDRTYRPLAGDTPVNLRERYAGNVLLVVNTASKCGFTPQYEGLEAMHARLSPRGFSVLGFPSNDFMGQEPGSEEDIREFCTLTYGVKFPMFEKVVVTGQEATPLYRDLAAATGEEPGWNFHKYLIGRDGAVVASFPSKTAPDDPALLALIERLLEQPVPDDE